ncbi:hypothetical protein GWI33_001140 [Rhynchophorus ferrugineus]|uniref:Uncharacterized protein n=1 Tax=Rhynchophorus ferrugineus TaxID=354439 RepID=A0A834MK66_RHYFE|nr:hypothetical protein GWI33_001140 [Rhynchophorus ferrugineus]
MLVIILSKDLLPYTPPLIEGHRCWRFSCLHRVPPHSPTAVPSESSYFVRNALPLASHLVRCPPFPRSSLEGKVQKMVTPPSVPKMMETGRNKPLQTMSQQSGKSRRNGNVAPLAINIPEDLPSRRPRTKISVNVIRSSPYLAHRQTLRRFDAQEKRQISCLTV